MSDPINNNIGDANVERLVREAYKPLEADSVFISQVENAMNAAMMDRRVIKVAFWKRPSVSGWISLAAMLTIVAGVWFVMRNARELDQMKRDLARGKDAPVIAASHEKEPAEPKFAGMTAKERALSKDPVLTAKTGDVIETKAGDKRRILLEDGSVLFVNQNSKVAIDSARMINVQKGEAFVEVAQKAGDQFIVKTPKRDVTALGTKFAVNVSDKGTDVLVTQGKVQVSGLEEPVAAGQQVLAAGGEIQPAKRASAMLDWMADLVAKAQSPLVPASAHTGGALVAIDPNGQEMKLSLRKYNIDVHIEDGFARTTIDQTFFNHENARLEGTFYFPLPPDAALSRLAMYVEGNLMEGGMAEREHARTVYENIVYTRRDPALLEWVDGSTFKMRVFPLEARQEKRIVLSYVQRLDSLYGELTYRFPQGHSMGVIRDWSFNARVKGGQNLNWISESHEMRETREGGNLAVETSAKFAAPDKDVSLTLFDTDIEAENARNAVARFNVQAFEGADYFMFRYRPRLVTPIKKERRDWIFIHETSAARDPLLARAQIDIIRATLENAEHDDTFTVITAATRTGLFSESRLPATKANIDKAIAFLNRQQLIGALDLAKALDAATEQAKGTGNPWIVHVGGGIATLGERREDLLVKKIPANAKYVGVGVGKRWSRQFMKNAAGQSGGYFTQINPDENVGWRAFDLVATLNTPRLVDVKVIDPANTASFLSYSDSLAAGEEMCAMAMLKAGDTLPKQVIVTGLLDGKPWKQEISVDRVNPNAGYLPRMWAKLEIDRLLAEDAAKNKPRIIELSKAMYVMSPFTSLLVLENEQMYKDFKVDRGRKDHWAMYACPDKIPVVHEPLAIRAAPATTQAAKPEEPSLETRRQQCMSTLYIRNPQKMLVWPGDRYQNVNVWTSYQAYHGAWGIAHYNNDFLGEGAENPDDMNRWYFGRPAGDRWREQLSEAKDRLLSVRIADFEDTPDFSLNWNRPRARGLERGTMRGRTFGNQTLAIDPQSIDGTILFETLAQTRESAQILGELDDKALYSYYRMINPNGVTRFDAEGFDLNEFAWGVDSRRAVRFSGATRLNAQDRFLGSRRIRGEWDGEIPPTVGFIIPETEGRMKLRRGMFTQDAKTRLYDYMDFDSDAIRLNGRVFDGYMSDLYLRKDLEGEGLGLPFQYAYDNRPWYEYRKPSFNNHWDIFTNLTGYAPGLNTFYTDILATLEKEVGPAPKLGQIDDRARNIINAARAAGWQKVASANSTLRFDGQGRFILERAGREGLREVVISDGTTLFHLYPELGLGAKRDLSAYHRAAFTAMIPAHVLSAEDLARGGDVICIDDNTIAIDGAKLRPRLRIGWHRINPQITLWSRVEMRFANNRLAETRWIDMPTGKILAREVRQADGTAVAFDADNKEIRKTTLNVESCDAPSLTPDKALVVLPMPYRESNSVAVTRKFDRHAAPETWHEDDALALLASYSLSRQDARDLIARRFFANGDKRLGFYTLLMANLNVWFNGQDYSANTGIKVSFDIHKDHPNSPLAKYIDQMSQIHRNGFQPTMPLIRDDGFVGRMSQLSHIFGRWTTGQYGAWDQPRRLAELKRVSDYVAAAGSTESSWFAIEIVQVYAGGGYQESRDAIAAMLSKLQDSKSLPYWCRYEIARSRYTTQRYPEARKLFADLYRQTLAAGVIPVFDSHFHSSFTTDAQGQAEWQALVADTIKTVLDRGGPTTLVQVANQYRQHGGTGAADDMLNAALGAINKDNEFEIRLAAVAYLKNAGDYPRAMSLLEPLLAEEENGVRPHFSRSKNPWLWRIMAELAQSRGQLARSIACDEKALDLELEEAGDMINLQVMRQRFAGILAKYQQLADAMATLEKSADDEIVMKVIRIADRWRAIDPEPTAACQAAARCLTAMGHKEWAWDYMTTPLAEKSNEAAPWAALASELTRQGEINLADRAYATAFEVEPTNAQALWDRAQMLQQAGRMTQARELYRQLANGTWQPRWEHLGRNAKAYLERN